MDELFDDTRFLITFPLWLPAHPTALASGIIQMCSSDGEVGTPMFTDEDLAERFIDSTPGIREAYVLGAFKSPWELLPFLDLCEKKGIAHVIIDPTGTEIRSSCPIDYLRQQIENLPEEPDADPPAES